MAKNVAGLQATDSAIALVKTVYPQKRIDKIWKLTSPLMAEVKTVDDFVGENRVVPMEHDHPAVSSTFLKAQTNRHPSSSEKFTVTRASKYATARLEAESIYAFRNDKGAFVRLLDREVGNTLAAMRKRVALDLYRDSNGYLGVVSTVDAGSKYLVCTNKSDVYNFSVGATIKTATDVAGTTSVSDTEVIEKIDFTNGRIYVETWFTTNAPTGSEYVFIDGDEASAISGLGDWCPSSTPGTLFSLDRSVAPERLGGHRITDTSLSTEEAIQRAAMLISYSTGGSTRPKLRAYMSPAQMYTFSLEMDSKVTRDPGGTGLAGFTGFNVATPAGVITVMSDPHCPEDRIFVGDLSTLELCHLEGLPHIVMDDGLRSLRISNADEIEYRFRLWGNMICHRPGAWCNITRPTVL